MGWGTNYWGRIWGGPLPRPVVFANGWVKEDLTHLIDGVRAVFPISKKCQPGTLQIFPNGLLQCCTDVHGGAGWGTGGWGTSGWGGNTSVKSFRVKFILKPGDQLFIRYRPFDG